MVTPLTHSPVPTTEYSDLYQSYSCAGVWSPPVYISTGNIPSTSWVLAGCTASIRVSAGFFPVSPPVGQTTVTPPIPTFAIGGGCISPLVGTTKFIGDASPDTIAASTKFNPPDFFWFPDNPLVPIPPSVLTQNFYYAGADGMTGSGSGTCDNQWGQALYTYPYETPPNPAIQPLSSQNSAGFTTAGAFVPGYEKYNFDNGFLEPISAMSGARIAIASNQECIIDSDAVTCTYSSRMMLVHAASFNHSIEFKIEFYASDGTTILGTLLMPTYQASVGNARLWSLVRLAGSVPKGTRFWRMFLTFNNPNALNFIYGFWVMEEGLRFQF